MYNLRFLRRLTPFQEQKSRRRLFGKGSLCALALLAFSIAGLHCKPLDHPPLDFPPCLEESKPAAGKQLPVNPTFQLTFSKKLEDDSIKSDSIFLVRGEVDPLFLRDLESPPVTETRAKLLALINISPSDSGDKTVLTIKPKEPLQPDSPYTLVLTKNIRDKLISLSEFRTTGNRPLNQCKDANGIWNGGLSSYKTGVSQVLSFRSEPRKGKAKIVEVMAAPPSDKKNGKYIEIINNHASETLDLRGLLIDNGSGAPRELRYLRGGGPLVKPKGRAVIVEPDYSLTVDPHGLSKTGASIYTAGTSTTLVSGGLQTSEPVFLMANQDTVLDQVSPEAVSGDGKWPTGKAYEKCNPDGKNTQSNWKETAGSPGRANTCK